MSTPPITPGQPTIPLTDEARAAYQSLYDTYEQQIENTSDLSLRTSLEDSQSAVDDILTKDAMYRLHADTALYQQLLTQISDTNKDLKKLKDQIAAIASHVALAGDIIAGIDRVLTLLPGI